MKGIKIMKNINYDRKILKFELYSENINLNDIVNDANSIDDIIGSLESIKEENKLGKLFIVNSIDRRAYVNTIFENLQLQIYNNIYYDAYKITISIYGTCIECDKDYNARIQREESNYQREKDRIKNSKIKKEENDRREYERLKKKFEKKDILA